MNFFYINLYDLWAFMISGTDIVPDGSLEEKNHIKLLKEEEFITWITEYIDFIKKPNEKWLLKIHYNNETTKIIVPNYLTGINIIIQKYPELLTQILYHQLPHYKKYIVYSDKVDIQNYLIDKIEEKKGKIILERIDDIDCISSLRNNITDRIQFILKTPFIYRNYSNIQSLKKIFLTQSELVVHFNYCKKCQHDFIMIMFHIICVNLYDEIQGKNIVDYIVYLPLITFKKYLLKGKNINMLIGVRNNYITSEYLDNFIQYKYDTVKLWDDLFRNSLNVPHDFDPTQQITSDCILLSN